MSNPMSSKRYTASMIFDTDDKIIVGRVLDIDDIISFHGESVAEFEANFHATIADYLVASPLPDASLPMANDRGS